MSTLKHLVQEAKKALEEFKIAGLPKEHTFPWGSSLPKQEKAKMAKFELFEMRFRLLELEIEKQDLIEQLKPVPQSQTQTPPPPPQEANLWAAKNSPPPPKANEEPKKS